jgi:hypothetical protein
MTDRIVTAAELLQDAFAELDMAYHSDAENAPAISVYRETLEELIFGLRDDENDRSILGLARKVSSKGASVT